MEYWMGTAASVRLEVGRADHFAPLFGLVGNEFSEFGRCHQHWVNAEAGKPRLYEGINRNGVDLPVELVDHLSGRVFWRTEPIPIARLVARHEFGQGRNIRQHIRTRCRCYSQRTQHAGPDVLNVRGYKGHRDNTHQRWWADRVEVRRAFLLKTLN